MAYRTSWYDELKKVCVEDDAEWVGHTPRNPCYIVMEHQGG